MFSKFPAGLNIDTTLTKATMLYAQTENVKIVTCTKPKKIEYYLAVMSVALNKITSSLVDNCLLSLSCMFTSIVVGVTCRKPPKMLQYMQL